MVVPVLAAEVPMPMLCALGGVVEAGVTTEILTPEAVWPPETLTTVGAVIGPPPETPPGPPELPLDELPPPQPAAKHSGARNKQSALEDMESLSIKKFDALMLGRVGLFGSLRESKSLSYNPYG